MNQQDLRDWERKCIQEELPWCQAACPIHVDVRSFMEKMKADDFDGARKILEKTMPLPGVLGSICDHPCESACKRREAGDPLAIGGLERVAIRKGRQGPKPLVLPAKGKKAAVLGSGLAALTCAWDLSKRGFAITIFCPGEALGGRLRVLPADLLDPAELDREVGRLLAMGVTLRTGQDLAACVQKARSGFDAVFVESGVDPCPASRDAVDPVTLACPGEEAVFCGGWARPDGTFSAMDEAYDGRRAANSMDRHMSGTSPTAMRDKEGPCETRLFTSLKGVTPLPRVAATGSAGLYAEAEARQEAARCLNCQCLECVKVCAYLEHYKGYPKKYARQFYNNAAVVHGVHTGNKMVNTCMQCGLCTEVCPERFSMAGLSDETRRNMVEEGHMPPSAHDFALVDLDYNNGPNFALAKPDPDTGTCAYLFFPGCQLSASHPHHVRSVYDHLRATLDGGVGMMLRCCAVPAVWAARQDLFEAFKQELLDAWKALGSPKVVVACSSCLVVFKERIPELEVVSMWEVFAEKGLPEAAGLRPGSPVALHDPCSSRHQDSMLAAVRQVLKEKGVAFEELELSGLITECCGYGGLTGNAHPEIARKVASRRVQESDRNFAASCAMCRDRLAAEGKRVWHVLDFLFLGPDVDPAAKGPGFSDRHENRARLKADLLRELWGETVEEAPALKIEYPAEVAGIMEQRRILREDVQAVVAWAESTGQYLVDKSSGRKLAYHRPRKVTYWVEYAKQGNGFVVSRAWSHRMEIPGAGRPLRSGEASHDRSSLVYLPEEGSWACACGGGDMQPGSVNVDYLGNGFAIILLTCSQCGLVLVPESLALGKMAEVELLLEDK